MFTKLTCVLLISTILMACNKKEKSLSIDNITMAPVEKTATDNIFKEPEQKIPVSDQLPVSDTVQSPSQTKSQLTPPTPDYKGISADWNKKIIKNPGVKLEVKSFKKYHDFLNNKVKQYGGYIAQEDNTLTDEKSETALLIKVPVQFFDGLINALTTTDTKLLEKSIKSEDVTVEIVDTRSRLEAKKQMRLKYIEFLQQSKNMSEVLQVQAEINNIQEEIESATGRYASLTTQASYSTINLTFFQPSGAYKPGDVNPSFLSKTVEAFNVGAAWISNLFIALISIWPLLGALAIGTLVYK